jgi:Ca-activated chloride channel family protein
VQTQIMSQTNRRPAVAGVALGSQFPSQTLIEVAFPSNLDVINKLLLAYLDQIRRPSHPVFVLDMSGSMAGDRIANLQRALIGLTGTDTSITGQFARFRNREQITLITFSDTVLATRDFTIDSTDPQGKSLTDIRNYVTSLQAGGATAIYDALAQAYSVVARDQATDPNRFYSVVLMTDGENNSGRSADDFLNYYRSLPGPVRDAPTFTVLFGEASPPELQRIADATGGRVFDSRNADLSVAFKEIRGYE